MAVADESSPRSDSETVVVLISTSFACLFLLRQLFYVKRRPEFLPFISISMLILLTLGYLVSLVPTLEALFVKKSDQDKILFEAGGWLMADQVAIMVAKLVAFLLQFHLLILSWSARSTKKTRIEIWAAEKKALIVTILLHVVMGISVVLVFAFSENYELFSTCRINLKSFGGLALDCFLLPQILVNVYGDFEGEFLSFTFYMGNTAVRLALRAYDLYREGDRHVNASLVYENSNDLFVSSGWNVIVFSCSVFLAFVMFAQQNLGA